MKIISVMGDGIFPFVTPFKSTTTKFSISSTLSIKDWATGTGSLAASLKPPWGIADGKGVASHIYDHYCAASASTTSYCTLDSDFDVFGKGIPALIAEHKRYHTWAYPPNTRKTGKPYMYKRTPTLAKSRSVSILRAPVNLYTLPWENNKSVGNPWRDNYHYSRRCYARVMIAKAQGCQQQVPVSRSQSNA